MLFFIIDGDGFDKAGTERAIVRASALPISIILIGVGGSCFTNLSSFDADDKPLVTAEGVSAARDVVQFVRFQDYQKVGGAVDKKMLAADLLRELPSQIETYCSMYGIGMAPAGAGAGTCGGGGEALPEKGRQIFEGAVGGGY